MAQDPIQALKLEISKQTRLVPYERISFHKILEILGFALLVFIVRMFVQIIHQDNMVLIKDGYKIKTQKQ